MTKRRWIILVALAVAVVGGFVGWRLYASDRSELELAAKKRLSELGALVVMDGARSHVAAVNLSTLKAPESIDEAIRLLAALPRLNSLNADNTRLADQHAQTIGRLASLEDLVLTQTAITDAGAADLSSLVRLKTLHLASTAVTNDAIPHVAKLPSLAILDLSNTRVTGDFEPLGELDQLKWLVVRKLRLDAAALASLGRCASLNRLSLSPASCPADALKQLAEARPELAIDE